MDTAQLVKSALTADNARDVEISIVNTNNRELLRRCLQTVEASCAGLTWRVTVVDNASTDGSAQMIADEFPWVRVLQNERRIGFGANHNQVLEPAIREHDSRYVFILNEDTELEPNAVADLVALCDERRDVGLAAPLLVYPDGSHQAVGYRFPSLRSELFSAAIVPERLRAWLWPRLVEIVPSDDRPTEVDWVLGAAMLARIEVLDVAGGFDERFFIYSEEVDLAKRIAELGFTRVVCHTACIRHVGGQSSNFRRMLGRSRWLYLTKHWSRPRLALLLIVLPCVYVWNSVYVVTRIAIAPTTFRPKLNLWLGHWRARPLPSRRS